MKKKVDYSKLSNGDLLSIYEAKTGGIPLGAVKEVQKRKLRKIFNRTITSNDTL